jgi:predicted PurR-regulated permease PerM
MKIQPVVTLVMGLLLAYLTFIVVRPFATPLIFAVVMVVVFEPLHARFRRRFGPAAAAGLGTASVVLFTLVPLFLVAGQVVGEAVDLVQSLDSAPVERALAQLQGLAARFGVDLEALVRQAAQQVAGSAGAFASRLVRDAWGVILGTIITMFATFFLFRDGRQIVDRLPDFIPLERSQAERLIEEVRAMMQSNIAASLVAASIQGSIGGVTFAILGLPAAVLWGVVMAFVSLFPVFGAWLVWGPAAIGLVLSGRTAAAAVLVGIGVAIVGSVDNIVRPVMLAHATRMNGLLVLISLLGGVQAFGLVGLLVGPLIISVVLALLSMYRKPSPHVVVEPSVPSTD